MRWLRFVPLILWIGLTFYFSTGNASMAKTSRFLRPLLETFFSNEETIHLANIIIRKTAHVVNYGMLALWGAFAFLGAPIEWLRKHWFWTAFGVVVVVATIDEINQSFDPSRIGSATDVMLDCIGAIIALSVIKIALSAFARRNEQ